MQPAAISPILILLVGAVLLLVVGIFLPRRLQTWNAFAALALLVVACLDAIFLKLPAPPGIVFHDTFAVDTPMLWTFIAIMAATGLCIPLAIPAFRGDAREAEFYVLLLFSMLGAVMLAGANDVMEIVLGVLLTSIGSYALVAYRRTAPPAMEGLLKYYLFGALTNIGLAYGLILFYGLAGTTTLTLIGQEIGRGSAVLAVFAAVLVLVGLGFKAGFVPGHFWIPDVYQGTTPPVAAYLSVVPKLAAILALARIVHAFPQGGVVDWAPILAMLSAVTMTWGNIAAFVQTDIRRLLGYSTIAQSGYLLMGVVALKGSGYALPGLLYYFAAYLAANIGAFAVVASTGRFEIPDNRALVRKEPLLALSMLVALLSLTGIPPLAGFVGKFTLFFASFEAGYVWLMIVGIINSVLGLYYYLRVLAPMFVPPAGAPPEEFEPIAKAVAVVCAFFSILLGIGGFFLLDAEPSFAALTRLSQAPLPH